MAERPILFSAPMVRAILAGTKTQTRRIVKRPANFEPSTQNPAHCGYGQPGDRLWVRESFHAEKAHAPDDYPSIHYRADMEERQHDGRSISPPHERRSTHAGPWTPSIHMPRWASRILLEVTEVRVERLQAITEGDALAEGVGDLEAARDGIAGIGGLMPRERFALLWDRINGSRASWTSNPWVWVVSFKRVQP